MSGLRVLPWHAAAREACGGTTALGRACGNAHGHVLHKSGEPRLCIMVETALGRSPEKPREGGWPTRATLSQGPTVWQGGAVAGPCVGYSARGVQRVRPIQILVTREIIRPPPRNRDRPAADYHHAPRRVTGHQLRAAWTRLRQPLLRVVREGAEAEACGLRFARRFADGAARTPLPRCVGEAPR